jgi:hypothetical protein
MVPTSHDLVGWNSVFPWKNSAAERETVCVHTVSCTYGNYSTVQEPSYYCLRTPSAATATDESLIKPACGDCQRDDARPAEEG